MATPADLVKVRQQATVTSKGGAPSGQTTWGSLRALLASGGVASLYVGVGPTVCRAAILTATQVHYS